jgi:hypothetical protein
MNTYAQVDLTLGLNIVTGLLTATAAPTVLPPGRQFVDITTLPNKDITGYIWQGGLVFTPPNEAVTLPDGIARIVQKLGA